MSLKSYFVAQVKNVFDVPKFEKKKQKRNKFQKITISLNIHLKKGTRQNFDLL